MSVDPAIDKAVDVPFRSWTAEQGTWSRAYSRFLDLLAAVSAAMIVFSMITVTGDVLLRYFFGKGILWSFEVTEFLLLYIPMLTMPWLARRGGHIQIDLLLTSVPPSWARIMNVASYLTITLLCAFIAYWSYKATANAYIQGAINPGMVPIPRWVIFAVMPPCFLLTAIEFFRLALIELKGDPK